MEQHSDLDNLLSITSSCSNSTVCLSPASAQSNHLSGVDLYGQQILMILYGT